MVTKLRNYLLSRLLTTAQQILAKEIHHFIQLSLLGLLVCPPSLHRLGRQLPLIMKDSGATGVTHLALLEWRGLDVGVEALMVVDVAAVHTLHMQCGVLIHLNSLGAASH